MMGQMWKWRQGDQLEVVALSQIRHCSKCSQYSGQRNGETCSDCFNDGTDLIGDKRYIGVRGRQ